MTIYKQEVQTYLDTKGISYSKVVDRTGDSYKHPAVWVYDTKLAHEYCVNVCDLEDYSLEDIFQYA